MIEGTTHSAMTREKMSIAARKPKPWLKGRKLTEEHKEKLRQAKLGKPSWNKGLPMWWTPARSKGLPSWNKGKTGLQVSTRKGKKYLAVSGVKHWNWQGGITPKNKSDRRCLEYKLWRKAVFERDDWTCLNCGARNGNGKTVELHADHIKQFAYYPELRFELSNGRTLCKRCHKETDTFSRRIC